MDPERDSWAALTDGIAGIARIDAASLRPQTRLVEDLGLDSLALTEVIVLLLVDFGLDDPAGELEERDWAGVTIGDVHAELTRRGATA
jgi:acyl carrier protein